MKLVGFCFIETQEDFEKWQLDNAHYRVTAIQPHLRKMAMRPEGDKYELGQDAQTVWGIFVTYLYDKEVMPSEIRS